MPLKSTLLFTLFTGFGALLNAQTARIGLFSDYRQTANSIQLESTSSNGSFSDFSGGPLTGGLVTGPGGFSENMTPGVGAFVSTNTLAGDAFTPGATYNFAIDGGGSYDVVAPDPSLLPAPIQFVNWQEIAMWDGSYPLLIEWTSIGNTDLQFGLIIDSPGKIGSYLGLQSTDTSFTLTENPFNGESFTEFTLGLSLSQPSPSSYFDTTTSMTFTVVPEPSTVGLIAVALGLLAIASARMRKARLL